MSTVPGTALADPGWVRGQIALTRRRHGPVKPPVLGTIWWYSASSVLVAPAIEGLVRAGHPADPALDALAVSLLEDGTLLGAASSRPLRGELGPALAAAIHPVIAAVESVTGARAAALRAVATDSIANRLLWTGQPERAREIAAPLVASLGGLPLPRFTEVGGTVVVRRASCCLLYQAGQPKCLSCPRQVPAERLRRLREALG
ncbi:(2Fe-2S)-binding protein [Amycolatopsis rhizosphaerae]|uniref:(2Fe-2S)-binding protein n=1 Tax=Amycolatopsis rhizosphaerae TaxID=2053003 RepID=A0A558AD96_9PSEU|nr:(2Fe-2S)-binding protein [Amycolatopsis rhizosphaerae]TVT22226.1 (2Fe-2S)-binding protein [Amycolatopsis rhizosphaerae]